MFKELERIGKKITNELKFKDMTRGKEIDKAGLEWFSKVKKYDADVAEAFMAGAKWADAHPKQIEISLEDIEELAKEVIPEDWVERQETLWDMIRRNQRAQFITKACEWLHSALYLDHERSIEHRYATLEELLNDFRKAMKGE